MATSPSPTAHVSSPIFTVPQQDLKASRKDIDRWAGIAFCIFFSGMFSGLNLAFFSTGRMELEVEAKKDNAKARNVLALCRDSNFLLVTTLWGNVAINVLLALLSGAVTAGLLACFRPWSSPSSARSCPKLVFSACTEDGLGFFARHPILSGSPIPNRQIYGTDAGLANEPRIHVLYAGEQHKANADTATSARLKPTAGAVTSSSIYPIGRRSMGRWPIRSTWR